MLLSDEYTKNMMPGVVEDIMIDSDNRPLQKEAEIEALNYEIHSLSEMDFDELD